MSISDLPSLTTFFEEFLSALGIVDSKNLIYLLLLFGIVGYVGINSLLFFSDAKHPKNWFKLNRGLQIILSVMAGGFSVFAIFIIRVWLLYKQIPLDVTYQIMLWFILPITLVFIAGFLAVVSVRKRFNLIKNMQFMKHKNAELSCLISYLILSFFLIILIWGVATCIDTKNYLLLAKIIVAILIIFYVNKFNETNEILKKYLFHCPTKKEVISSAEEFMNK